MSIKGGIYVEQCNNNPNNITNYQQENQQLGDYFLEHYFFEEWRSKQNSDKPLELIISPKCNLACRYCYLHKYHDKIFNDDFYDEENTITNLKQILQWLAKNQLRPNLDIFSGELLAQEIGYKVLQTILDFERSNPPELRPFVITIPTNFTFIHSKEKKQAVLQFLKQFDEIGIQLFLSASFDGKFMEDNRPYAKDLDIPLNYPRDDAYYDEVFEFCAKTQSGLHPMLYSRGMDKWIENFQWFESMMAKHNIPWENIYLLQVRNEEWNIEQVQEFRKFIKFLFDYACDKLDNNVDKIIDFLLHGGGFNILSQPFCTTGRGLTCGAQSELTIRVSDLCVYPCHRLGYEKYWYGHMQPDPEQILKFEAINSDLMVAFYGVHKNALPLCSECLIQSCCLGPCLGSQHESNNDMFVPIPSVCSIAYALVTQMVECLCEHNMFGVLTNNIGIEQCTTLVTLKEELGL